MLQCPACGAPRNATAKFCSQCGAPLPVQAVPSDAFIGKQIGNYRVLSVIGEGGMGKVYRAEQVKLKLPVCIKTLLPALTSKPQVVQRFERESQATAAMRHPNIVQIMDFGRTDDGSLYFVMEYVHGKTLKQVISEESPLPIERVLLIVEQILSALHEAHSHHIVHRDLKPNNVLVAKLGDGTDLVKVVDFGIARIVGQGADAQERLTQTGMMVGTPGYMPPEQILGREPEAATDLYACGVLLWEMLTGQKLFAGSSDLELAQKHVMQAPPSPSSAAKLPLPAGLDAIVLKALEKQPERRHRSALEMRRALELVRLALRGVTGVSPIPPGLGEQATPASAPSGAQLSQLSGLRGTLPDNLLSYATKLTDLAASSERRPLTVLFAEVGGQAALAEVMDAAAVRTAINQLHESLLQALVKAGGLGERFMGNCVLAVFGAVQAQEDDTERALKLALEMVRLLRQANAKFSRAITLRIGVHTAIVSGVGGGSLLESPAVTEVLTVARRLAAAAPTEKPLVTRAVQRMGQGRLSFTEKPPLAGEEALGPVFELAGTSEDEDSAKEPIVGREVELGHVRTVLDLLKNRRVGGMLLLGTAGLGKTRLLQETARISRDSGMLVARARGGRFGADTPLDVVRQLVQSLSRRESGRADPSTHTSLGGLTRLGVSAQDVARLEHLFSSGGTWKPTGQSAEDEHSLDRAAMLSLFHTAAQAKPLVLLLDDAHLCDAASIEIIGEVLARSAKAPVCFVAAARPQNSERLWPKLKRIELKALDRRDLAELIGHRLPSGKPSVRLTAAVVDRCDGNPGYAREILTSLVESGAAKLVQGEWTLSADGAGLPESLVAVTAARLDRLTPAGRLLLRVGAACGRVFPVELVAAAVETPLDVGAAAAECVERGIIAPAEQHQGSYQFVQALLHEAALQRIAAEDLKALHLRIGEAVERGISAGAEAPAAAMARHFMAADQPRKAARYLKLTADRLAERNTPAAAVEAYKVCIDLLIAEGKKVGQFSDAMAQQLLDITAQAAATQSLLSVDAALKLVEPVLELVPPTRAQASRAAVLRQQGLCLSKLSRHAEAEKLLNEALGKVTAQEHPQLMAELRADVASVLEAKGDFSQASQQLLEGMKLMSTRRAESGHLMWQYLNQLGRLHLRMQKLTEAQEFFVNARAQAQLQQSPFGESKVVANLAVLAAQKKDDTAALSLFDEARALADRAGDRIGVLRVRYNRARLLRSMGHAEEAMNELNDVVAASQAIGWREGEALAASARR